MRILVADKLDESGIQALESAGHKVVFDPALNGESLQEALIAQKSHILIVRSTKVTAEMMDANPKLELIVRAGAGYDTIDVDAASDRGVFVANCPGKNAVAVAELAFALILAIDRKVADNVSEARAGRWDKGRFSKAEGLKGRTLGLIGLGSIGTEMVGRARAFGMPVIAWSRSLTDERAAELNVKRANSPLDVARNSDMVSLHVASTPETRHLVNTEFLDAMRPGAVLINTTRGAVVDEEALLDAIEKKGIVAGLDVFDSEPAYKQGDLATRLASNPNIYLTHHIGASTHQASQAIGEEAVRVVTVYCREGAVPNCVNVATDTEATHLLTIRHHDKVGVLASVLDEMRKSHWNVQEMENLVFAGGDAACARIWFGGDGNPATVDRIESNPDVIAANLIALDDGGDDD